jgi:putative flippase GtrA
MRAVRFGVVGLTGVAVNQALIVVLTEFLGLHYLASAILATEGSTLWNFGWIDIWALRGRARGAAWRRLLAYAAVNNATLILRLPVLWALTEAVHLPYAWSNLITLALMFLLRFAISDRWIWGPPNEPGLPMPGAVADLVAVMDNEAAASQVTLRHRYDIAGILRVDSDTALPELAFFRTGSTTPPDIRIRVGPVGGWPSRQVRFTPTPERVTYHEQLGRLGANFEIRFGQPIEVTASRLLATSRHVLYTNVVEALLRFALVERGYVLLHSGCVSMDGQATLLSAQTDTGKTSTVIRLVRDEGYAFMSDDMTIISPTGSATSYPKPMTMSFHTLATIAGAKLRMSQRAKLSVQGRVHSKSGRTIGRALGTLNIPIMAINSATQIAVPPPKYHIDSLVDCEIAERAAIRRIVFIERGEPVFERMPLTEAVDKLIENTDDAYGFPPFSTMAPHFRMGGSDYEDLRRRERELLAGAIAGAEVWRLRVEGHDWAPIIANLDRGGSTEPGARTVVGIPIEPASTEVELARATLLPD